MIVAPDNSEATVSSSDLSPKLPVTSPPGSSASAGSANRPVRRGATTLDMVGKMDKCSTSSCLIPSISLLTTAGPVRLNGEPAVFCAKAAPDRVLMFIRYDMR